MDLSGGRNVPKSRAGPYLTHCLKEYSCANFLAVNGLCEDVRSKHRRGQSSGEQ